MTPPYKSRPKSLGSLSGNSFSRSFNKVKKIFDRHLYWNLKVCFSRQVKVVPPQAGAARVTALYVAVRLTLRTLVTVVNDNGLSRRRPGKPASCDTVVWIQKWTRKEKNNGFYVGSNMPCLDPKHLNFERGLDKCFHEVSGLKIPRVLRGLGYHSTYWWCIDGRRRNCNGKPSSTQCSPVPKGVQLCIHDASWAGNNEHLWCFKR